MAIKQEGMAGWQLFLVLYAAALAVSGVAVLVITVIRPMGSLADNPAAFAAFVVILQVVWLLAFIVLLVTVAKIGRKVAARRSSRHS